jgi:hypothetical protein
MHQLESSPNQPTIPEQTRYFLWVRISDEVNQQVL